VAVVAIWPKPEPGVIPRIEIGLIECVEELAAKLEQAASGDAKLLGPG